MRLTERTSDCLYLDYNAATPSDPRVVDALNHALLTLPGNPSNRHHRFGRDASVALNAARAEVARLFDGCHYQVIFTSGATEALNLALVGMRPARVLVNATEHRAVLELCRTLAHGGAHVEKLPVDADGRVDLAFLAFALKEPASLVVLQWCNSETGVLQPLDEALELAHAHGVPLLCDAGQAVGKVPISLLRRSVDMLVASSHKIYAPPGVGVLMLRENTMAGRLRPVLYGGGQEFGLRPGTENVPHIVAFVRALELAVGEQDFDSRRIRTIRDAFEARLTAMTTNVVFNGVGANRIANTSNFSLINGQVAELLNQLTNVAVSTGSACESDDPRPSHVLRAMGRSVHLAANAVRVSFGRFTADMDGVVAANRIATAIHELQVEAP
ncbi:cysteine desulfurase family protein [Lentzea sp. HUAS12]|uniref:cysteine desulfurase family protein n=1 Tax=Lentzea sp. HUAS12 TaxID=2951806 RepID=UPI0020A1FDA0|nr:cysteine desulfurase family protein [Lentzea sp. HUAS12]USX56216.1 cysteine desulfurase [Lentzea sp. HUAS12]